MIRRCILLTVVPVPACPSQTFTMIFVPRFGRLRLLNIVGLATVGVNAIYIIVDCCYHGFNFDAVKMCVSLEHSLIDMSQQHVSVFLSLPLCHSSVAPFIYHPCVTHLTPIYTPSSSAGQPRLRTGSTALPCGSPSSAPMQSSLKRWRVWSSLRTSKRCVVVGGVPAACALQNGEPFSPRVV